MGVPSVGLTHPASALAGPEHPPAFTAPLSGPLRGDAGTAITLIIQSVEAVCKDVPNILGFKRVGLEASP